MKGRSLSNVTFLQNNKIPDTCSYQRRKHPGAGAGAPERESLGSSRGSEDEGYLPSIRSRNLKKQAQERSKGSPMDPFPAKRVHGV